ncbi:PQQ-binding-like beta-propeller repeat protein [Nonomuraea sp. NPDC052116]|uniref:PQQ-binding-like beta-propeller repeat protein n=1 Tax=Nonomuraea sp. NPDC052116 TaxID=3155665 RepID=UPI003426B1DF
MASGLVYATGADSMLHALDPTTGTVRRSFPTGGPIETRPVVAGDFVYVGGSNGDISKLSG